MPCMTIDGTEGTDEPTPFTRENLVKFELEFFSAVPNAFRNATGGLRYGQALENVFRFDTLYGERLYNETDTGLCRNIAWFKFEEIGL